MEAECLAAGVAYLPFVLAGEEEKAARRQRLGKLRSRAREARELATPGLDAFLAEVDLPLSLQLHGHMMRSEGQGVAWLMQAFRAVKLDQVFFAFFSS